MSRSLRLTLTVGTISRLASAPVAAAALSVLAVSAWLAPDGAGHGTHTQLGLAPCTIFVMTGWPCPMCGMTTSFALMAEGRVLEAAWNQPFGVALFVMTVGVAGIALAELLWPTDRWRRLGSWLAPWEAPLSAAFLVGLGLGWVWKVCQMVL